MTPSPADRVRSLAALADPIRLGVVDALQGQDLSPASLAARLEIPGNLLAHHLGVLEQAGIITRRPSQHDRRRSYVQLVDGAFDGLLPQPGPLTAPRVVFVCTHNSARSVLAEALWRDVSEVPSASAGTSPAAQINPRALKAAERFGLTVKRQAPQSIDDVLRPDDVLVSVCDAVNEELGDVANERIHWSIADPASVGTDAAFAEVVRDLRHRTGNLAPRIRYRRHSRKGNE